MTRLPPVALSWSPRVILGRAGPLRPPVPCTPLRAFGRRVSARRLELGLTKEQLGQACGVEAVEIDWLEEGVDDVELTTILNLAAALDVDPADLIAGLEP